MVSQGYGADGCAAAERDHYNAADAVIQEMRAAVVWVALRRRQLRYVQIGLLITCPALFVLGDVFGTPGWLPMLLLGVFAVVASYDMIVFPGVRGVLRQGCGVIVLVMGIFAVVLAVRLMGV